MMILTFRTVLTNIMVSSTLRPHFCLLDDSLEYPLLQHYCWEILGTFSESAAKKTVLNFFAKDILYQKRKKLLSGA